MDADSIRAIFDGIATVRIRPMFGGQGVFDGATMFALEYDGDIYLKAAPDAHERLISGGSEPFCFIRAGRRIETSYWRLLGTAFDDAEELRRWTLLALRSAHDRTRAPLKRRDS